MYPPRQLHLPRGGAIARAHSCTHPDVLLLVYIHLGIRRMDASPRRVSIREFQMVHSTTRDVGPSAIVIMDDI